MPKKKFCLNDEKDYLHITWTVSPRPMNAKVVAAAKAKGFSAICRLAELGYYALRCNTCGELSKVRHGVVLQSQPTCSACLVEVHKTKATKLDLTLLRRDPVDRHYAIYRMPCGHEARRQMSLLDRVATGATGLRCEICLTKRQEAEAAGRGWSLIGPDAAGRRNYRLYRHEACHGYQSVALANMRTGRFDCAKCGQSWVAARSALYAMQFRLADDITVVKLGYSKDPVSRLTYQLLSGRNTHGEILRTLSMPSGASAIRAEKRMHKELQAQMPEAVLPASHFADQIKVRSEIYAAAALPLILSMLDAEATRLCHAA